MQFFTLTDFFYSFLLLHADSGTLSPDPELNSK